MAGEIEARQCVLFAGLSKGWKTKEKHAACVSAALNKVSRKTKLWLICKTNGLIINYKEVKE